MRKTSINLRGSSGLSSLWRAAFMTTGGLYHSPFKAICTMLALVLSVGMVRGQVNPQTHFTNSLYFKVKDNLQPIPLSPPASGTAQRPAMGQPIYAGLDSLLAVYQAEKLDQSFPGLSASLDRMYRITLPESRSIDSLKTSLETLSTVVDWVSYVPIAWSYSYIPNDMGCGVKDDALRLVNAYEAFGVQPLLYLGHQCAATARAQPSCAHSRVQYRRERYP